MQKNVLNEEELANQKKLISPHLFHPPLPTMKVEEPDNLNELCYLEDIDPTTKSCPAGTYEDPLFIDQPASGTCFDELECPDQDLPRGCEVKAMNQIPEELLLSLEPQVLVSLPSETLKKPPKEVLVDLLSEISSAENPPILVKESSSLELQNTFDLNTQYRTQDHQPPQTALATLTSCSQCYESRIECNVEKSICLHCRQNRQWCSLLDEPRDRQWEPPEPMTIDSPDGPIKFEPQYHVNRPIKIPRHRIMAYFLGRNDGADTTSSQARGTVKEAAITSAHLPLVEKSAMTFCNNDYDNNPVAKPDEYKNSHLNLRADTNVPAMWHPKPTFCLAPNIPKIPLVMRDKTQIEQTKLFDVNGCIKIDLDGIPAYNSFLQEDNFHNRPSIRITIPDHLKNLLVDDWENVTKSLLLVPLPSQAPANFILDSYFNEEKSNRRLGSPEADVLEEFVAGMKVYFEKAVGKILLYRFERSQLAEVSQSISRTVLESLYSILQVRKLWESGKYQEWDGKGPGDCYGAEHLTRLLGNSKVVYSHSLPLTDIVTL